MRERLGFGALLLGLALASSDASAGAHFGGVCFDSAANAARAYCVSVTVPQFAYSYDGDLAQHSTTQGRFTSTRSSAVHLFTCSVGTVVESSNSAQLNITGSGQSTLSQVSTVAGTGYTYPAAPANSGLSNASVVWLPTVQFPTCEAQATPAEQVQAVMSLWPFALAAVATAWGFAFIRRRVVRWHEAGDAA